MKQNHRISVIIPMLNEEQSIRKVIAAIPDWVDDIITVDNGSVDRSARVAQAAGARVLHEPRTGYGNACLKGISAIEKTDIVVFLDGDFSDYPEEMSLLVDPILNGEAEFVIGSRVLGRREPGALTPQARFGNWLSCWLIRRFWGVKFTDLGPFRAIKWSTLKQLDMKDPNYGWTVEMQIKAAKLHVPTTEIPVSYRRRIGKSKVSGTVKGVFLAGTKILWTIFQAAVRK
ncbi:MAG: glycosyltransferase family 2 protein [Calditrichia bacterium]